MTTTAACDFIVSEAKQPNICIDSDENKRDFPFRVKLWKISNSLDVPDTQQNEFLFKSEECACLFANTLRLLFIANNNSRFYIHVVQHTPKMVFEEKKLLTLLFGIAA